MQRFQNGDLVNVTKNGVTVKGYVRGQRTVFYPDCNMNKYGSGSVGRAAWGYTVSAPIVSKDGTILTDARGFPIRGSGYVEEKLIQKIS